MKKNSAEDLVTWVLTTLHLCHIGNILTVAEDLLENDGKKFLEMMDRLADRKVQRDDELMDQRGVYDEYEDEEEGDFEDDGADEVMFFGHSVPHFLFFSPHNGKWKKKNSSARKDD